MKRSEASRYARISAIAAFGLAAITGGIYLQRKWVAHVEKKNAPPAPPRDVERQSSGLTFSKVEGTRVIYTVHAMKSTDFKGQDASLLEEVVVTAFGKNNDRNDVLKTKSCQYAKGDGSIQCSGEVLMDLESAADAARSKALRDGKAGLTHVETSGVTFDRATGVAQTVQPVRFTFPSGSGKAIGGVYSTNDGQLKLIRSVELDMDAAAAAAKGTGASRKKTANSHVLIVGNSLEFAKDSRQINLSGLVTATTSAQELTAGELTVQLDAASKVQNLVATGGVNQQTPEVTTKSAGGSSKLRAEKITSFLAPDGWVSSVKAEGRVLGNSAEGLLSADTGLMEMWPRLNEAKLLTLRGNVQVNSQDPKTGKTRTLKTNALQLSFSGGPDGQPSHLTHGETLERGAVEWTDSAGAHSRLEAAKLAVEFGAKGKPEQMTATGGVQTERERKGKPLETASASTGAVQMDSAGEWSKINLHGAVHMKEGDRSAESEEAVLVHEPQTAVLTGKAVARDASSETHATRITFHQVSGDILAVGAVRSTEFSTKDGAVQLAAVPANLSSDRLEANSKSGRALYTGHARLWQGPSVLEADSIELLRATRVMNAVGNVQSVFEQAPASGVVAREAAKPPALWHVASETLTYLDMENRARLEGTVVVQSADQKIRSKTMDLYFTRLRTGSQSAGGTPAPVAVSQISRAVGNGGVVVEEGDRRALAENGVYTAADQKFVLSGGDPILYDGMEGTTKGRELTFYIASDTIIVDSGNGLRTLTRHRVQR